MRCLVTAGPTWEPLDQVRRLTNFSTGALGGELANFLALAGHEVRLFLSDTATWHAPLAVVATEAFSTTQSLAQVLRVHAAAGAVAVFHTAAVSDFTGGAVFRGRPEGLLEPVHAGKVPSDGSSLFLELRPTPKILPQLRGWFPDGLIVGWKYEVDGSELEAIERGRNQLVAARSDACIVNGPAHGDGFSLLRPSQPAVRLTDRPALFRALAALP